jgi:hypothetical protein
MPLAILMPSLLGLGLAVPMVPDGASLHLQVPVAIKSLRVGPGGPVGTELGDFLREVSVMMNLDHPHVLHLHGLVLGQPLQMVSSRSWCWFPIDPGLMCSRRAL